jgi:hypothetical protein
VRDARLDRWGRPLLVGLAALGLLAGLVVTAAHLATDPLADVHAYYEAGQRLNEGLGLYSQTSDVNGNHFYFYPPLLAIVFRPLALLPFGAAAAIWETAMLASFALTLRLLGLRFSTGVALGLLALPIGWTLSIGQAQALVTLLLVVGSPFAIALAANLKLFPILVGVYWLGRRDWSRLARMVGWLAALGLVQLVLEPSGTIAFASFPNLGQVGEINNLSPYAVSPVLWVVLVAVLAVAALRLAPTRFGWAAAVALSVLATPRLLSYLLMALLATLRRPREVPVPSEPRITAATPARRVVESDS